jgi:hemoglobin-like flavoprotein
MFTSDREVLSYKFAEMLESIVRSVDNPQKLHEQLKGLAPMHLKLGVKKEYLPTFGKTLVDVISGQMKGEFTESYRAAWEWLWSWLSQSMTQSLEEASAEATILSTSWDMAMDNFPGNEFGEMLFDVLFELAPNMKQLFNKPKQILSVKFMEMLSTLVSFNGDAKRMAEQSVWLGMRHVRYGARPQHVQVLGQVVVTCMERAVGDEWTAEMDKAWTELWQESCSAMLKVTMDADKHGEVVRELWEEAKKRTTCQKFGSSLRKSLLSGTEWVQGLSSHAGKQDDEKDGKDGKGSTAEGSQSKRSKGKKASVSSVSLDEGKKGDTAPIVGGAPKDVNATFADKSSDADAIGTQFWEMLTVLLDLLWEPEQMNERLTVTTHHFFSLGIRSDHLDTIGTAIHSTLEKIMGASWSTAQSDAWKWFWSMVATSMVQVLDVLESGDVEVIRQSWEDAKLSKPAEELGEIFFKELARIAPHVTHLFKRPKRIQALQFTNVIEMLVSFNEDPGQFFADLKPLTIRHIKYGVKADYARAFGMTVLNGIASVLGDRFDERVKSAWVLLWTRVSSCVTRSLNVGSNLVIVSLVQENLEQLEDAMDCVPRGERDEVLTKIDVNGEIISPLNWAVSGGQLAMAQFVMGDLLAIRADRYRYYYGRETLFKTHPDLVQSVSSQMPALLDTLFDGLMWHAQMVNDGRVRVNYYIRELYGVPEEVKDVWVSPMGVLVLAGQSNVFNHPVVEKLLAVKWERFGLKMYSVIQIWYVIMLILFTLGFVTYQNTCAKEAEVVRLATGGMATMTLLLQTIVLCYQFRSGQVSRCTSGIQKMPDIVIPRFLMNPWNSARYVSSAMLIANAFSDLSCLGNFHRRSPMPGDDSLVREHGVNVLGAVTAIFIWLQLIQVLILSERMAAFTYTVGRMVKDFVQNFVVIFVVMVAFSAAMTILEAPGGFSESLGSSIYTIIKITIGLASDESVEQESWAMICLIVLTIIVNIGFLNILVAQLVLAYSQHSSDQEGCAKMNRAYICVEMESFLSLKYRQKLFDELSFDEPLEFDSSDEGPCGGIQSLCPASVRSHPKYVPDRVQRFTGEASVMDPWPSDKNNTDEYDEERNDDCAVE